MLIVVVVAVCNVQDVFTQKIGMTKIKRISLCHTLRWRDDRKEKKKGLRLNFPHKVFLDNFSNV